MHEKIEKVESLDTRIDIEKVPSLSSSNELPNSILESSESVAPTPRLPSARSRKVDLHRKN